MKKSFFCIGFLAVLSLFAGCKKDNRIHLKVWESLGGPDAFIQQAGKIYSERHPDVAIDFINVELGDAAGQIALDGPAGVGPDVFAAPHDKLGELVMGGHVSPTENPAAAYANVMPNCKKALTYDGTLYGYPVSAETYALFYNKKLISEDSLPKTWEGLRDWASDFNAANPGKYGFMMDVGSGYYTIVFTTKNGNRLFGADGTDTVNTRLNNNESVEGMKFFQTLRSVLDVPAADLNTATADAAFRSGNAAMHITGLWNVVPFKEAGIDFGIAALPSLPGESTPASSFSGTRAMYVSSYSKHPEIANDFAAFLVSDEMQQLRFELTGAMPSVNISVDSEYIRGFKSQFEYSFPMPSIPQMGAFWDAMNSASKNIWDGADVKKELDACNGSILGL